MVESGVFEAGEKTLESLRIFEHSLEGLGREEGLVALFAKEHGEKGIDPVDIVVQLVDLELVELTEMETLQLLLPESVFFVPLFLLLVPRVGVGVSRAFQLLDWSSPLDLFREERVFSEIFVLEEVRAGHFGKAIVTELP